MQVFESRRADWNLPEESELLSAVQKWLQAMEATPPDFCGSTIWLAHSTDPADDGMAVGDVLKHFGAQVFYGTDCEHPLEETTERSKLHRSDAIIVFASTPDLMCASLEFCHEQTPESRKLAERIQVSISSGEAEFLRRRLTHHGAYVIEGGADKFCLRIVSRLMSQQSEARRTMTEASDNFEPTIGLVVALDCEFTAALAILKDKKNPVRKVAPTFREYQAGYVDAYGGGRHKVVLTAAGMGNNKAVAAAMNLISDFPSIADVIMVGVAGGFPALKEGQTDIRLGDVIVSDEDGIVQTDYGKMPSSGMVHTPPPRPAAHNWATLSQSLLRNPVALESYWAYVDEIAGQMSASRPDSDILDDSPQGVGAAVERPASDPKRVAGRPLTHRGKIGSGNVVVKSATEREALRSALSIVAIEMEASGVAEASWQGGRGYTVVRGICDYANDGKNKSWQPYAAAAAAAFTRYLIENMPLHESAGAGRCE